MKFRRAHQRDEPDINLIPLIDVLLVILIFLAASTAFTKVSALQVVLPTAQQTTAVDRSQDIVVSVAADGRYAVDGKLQAAGGSPAQLAEALKQAAAGREAPAVVVNADAAASHQSVIQVMEAARLAQIGRLNFATQNTPAAPAR
jgi:biopolymer transport protein ExbD